ncbi:hypothetical protein C7212DRAFT_209861 [Tuber magnatum]|uniref:Tc1-like transposase DDE domain-containing protein n=1 Tax=Tuber magnatum TaxID=42249 RepID=A0A317SJI1_9PEZI|nr:hypothetical protein C7212DRAFT_209861 [Tuber magnatum]
MECRQAIPKGQRPRGRPANPYKITKKSRGNKRKGGIDWFRYHESVCEQRLYPFYRQLVASAEHGERGQVFLIEDGAGPHRSKFLNEHHSNSGINKIAWPASSPDLNPIERVWDYIRRHLAKLQPFPTTKEATLVAWEEIWKSIPFNITNSFFAALPRRLAEVSRQNCGNLYNG